MQIYFPFFFSKNVFLCISSSFLYHVQIMTDKSVTTTNTVNPIATTTSTTTTTTTTTTATTATSTTYIEKKGRKRQLKKELDPERYKYIEKTDNNQYCCRLCRTYIRDSWSSVHYHVNGVHLNIRKHSCEICFKSFHTAEKVKSHLLTHTNQKKFTCEFCHKSFKTAYKLTDHMETHLNKTEQKFHCDFQNCEFKAWKNADLTKHIKRVHEKEKHFECLKCFRQFATRSKLQNHIKSITACDKSSQHHQHKRRKVSNTIESITETTPVLSMNEFQLISEQNETGHPFPKRKYCLEVENKNVTFQQVAETLKKPD